MGYILGRVYPGGADTTMSPSGSGSGGGLPGSGGGLDVGAAYAAMLERASLQNELLADQLNERRRAREPKVSEGFGLDSGPDAATRRLQENALQRDIAETDAVTGRAPTTVATVGEGVSVGPSDLTAAAPQLYTGAQRKMFGPENASLSPSSSDAYAAMLEAQTKDDWRKRNQAERERSGGLGRE